METTRSVEREGRTDMVEAEDKVIVSGKVSMNVLASRLAWTMDGMKCRLVACHGEGGG